MIPAGELNRRVTLLIPAVSDGVTHDASGAAIIPPPTPITVFAKTEIGSGRSFFGAHKINNNISGIIWIRHRSDVTAAAQVMVDGALYDVAAPPISCGERTWDGMMELHLSRTH